MTTQTLHWVEPEPHDHWGDHVFLGDYKLTTDRHVEIHDTPGGERAVITLVWPVKDVAADPAMQKVMVNAFRSSNADFRTPASLARELGLEEGDVRSLLDALLAAGVIRRPIGVTGPKYGNWFRLTSRGMTVRERLGRWRASAGRGA